MGVGEGPFSCLPPPPARVSFNLESAGQGVLTDHIFVHLKEVTASESRGPLGNGFPLINSKWRTFLSWQVVWEWSLFGV